MQLYGDLTPWYRLIDPYEDHLDEAVAFTAAIERHVRGGADTLLELGAGAGHNGYHLKRRFRCTLADLSPQMSALSRELNPECEHVLGDMRDIRLGRTFDAVLIHDAIVYMCSEADLRAALATAFAHLRPGGVALFVPDVVRDEFAESTELLAEDDGGGRSMRGLMWSWDPDPADDQIQVEFALVLREGRRIEAVHDTHLEGLFARAVWLRLLGAVGFEIHGFDRPLGAGAFDRPFVGYRP